MFRWISKKDESQWRVLIDHHIVALIKLHCGQIGLDQGGLAAASALSTSEMMKRTLHRRLSSVQVYKRSEDSFGKTAD